MPRKDIAKKLVEALPGKFSRQDTQLSFDFAASAPRGIKKAETYVQVVIRAIKHTLLLGESVGISGFGKFIIRRKKERIGRNPVNRVHHNGISSFFTRIKGFFTSGFKTSFRGGTGVGMKKSKVSIFTANIINNNALPGLALTEESNIKKGEKNLIEKNGSRKGSNLSLLGQSQATLTETIIREGDTVNVYLSHSRLTLDKCQVERAQKPGIYPTISLQW